MTDVALRQPAAYDAPMGPGVDHVRYDQGGYERQSMEAAELAAFEKGRMQGEMEAIRRAEAEAPLKTMAPTGAELQMQQDALAMANAPDVIEINRLTWVQKISAVLGELSSLAMVILTIVWIEEYRDGFGWTNSRHNGDWQHLNAGLLVFALGLFFNAQAISNYRILPVNHRNSGPWFHRAWYVFMQACAITCYLLAFATIIMTPPFGEHTYWRVDNWCLALALLVYLPHALISMGRALIERVWPVKYETWAEIPDTLDHSYGRAPRTLKGTNNIPASGLDAHGDRRTIYTEAPVPLSRGKNLPAANQNVGAQVPVAPANAPRWAENPRTHAEDYFLLWRAKWANVAFWAMGASFLMLLAAIEQTLAVGRGYWAQGDPVGPQGPINQDGRQAHLIGCLGLVTIAALTWMSYASMPPRTTLVKNGVIAESRRPSISYNADTNLGGRSMNVV